MLHIKKQDLLIDTFDNISELDKFLKDPKNYKPGRENSSQSGNQWFTGTDNYEQAEELLKYGDVETFKFIKEKQRELKIDKIIGNVINKPKTFNNIVGYQPNVPLYLNRVPTNMIDSKKIKTDFKIINIYLDVCASARVEADEIRNAGTIYATVLDMLEKSGYRTNLYIGDVSELGNEKVMYALKIKTDREIFRVNNKSNNWAGIGIIIISTIVTSPIARTISLFCNMSFNFPKFLPSLSIYIIDYIYFKSQNHKCYKYTDKA